MMGLTMKHTNLLKVSAIAGLLTLSASIFASTPTTQAIWGFKNVGTLAKSVKFTLTYNDGQSQSTATANTTGTVTPLTNAATGSQLKIANLSQATLTVVNETGTTLVNNVSNLFSGVAAGSKGYRIGVFVNSNKMLRDASCAGVIGSTGKCTDNGTVAYGVASYNP
jgi:hypothetical protein